jgi:tRNA (Thr-GGU) A37 N-methylase
MEHTYNLKQIGKVIAKEEYFEIQLNKEYTDALTNIEGFSHLQLVWWGDHYDSEEFRSITVTEKPYKKGPDKLGIFGNSITCETKSYINDDHSSD